MFRSEHVPRERNAPEEMPRIDAAVSCWDPFLISMYIDAVRAVEAEAEARRQLH